MGSFQNRAYRETAGWQWSQRHTAITAGSASPPELTAAAKKVAEIFALAGIEIGGRRPWDLQVYDPRFCQRLRPGGGWAAVIAADSASAASTAPPPGRC